jgi:hypothetical protein
VARPKTPNAWKIISGSRRVERGPPEGVPIAPLKAPPPPPEWLPNIEAINEWHRLTKVLIINRLITELDLGALAHLCALHGKLTVTHTEATPAPKYLTRMYNSLSVAFGATPIARNTHQRV